MFMRIRVIALKMLASTFDGKPAILQ